MTHEVALTSFARHAQYPSLTRTWLITEIPKLCIFIVLNHSEDPLVSKTASVYHA